MSQPWYFINLYSYSYR